LEIGLLFLNSLIIILISWVSVVEENRVGLKDTHETAGSEMISNNDTALEVGFLFFNFYIFNFG
jgi:hypothetical protein